MFALTECRLVLSSCGLGLAAASGCHATSASPRGISTSSSVLGKAAATLASATSLRTSPTSTHTSSVVEAAAVRIGSWTAFLNPDLLSANVVWIRGYGALVASSFCEFDEGAVLLRRSVIESASTDMMTYLLTADIEVHKFPMLGQSSFQERSIHFIGHVFHVA